MKRSGFRPRYRVRPRGKTPHEATKEEIRHLVEAYAAAALRSRNAGFDGVQLHGAHGYGINQFLSPAWNRRGDAYGGNAKNRYRFLGEVMEAVKGAVGDDFPVLIKLSGHDYLEKGLVPQDTVEIGRYLNEDGIAAIEVSGGNSDSPDNLGPVRRKINKEEDESYFADLSLAMKHAVKVPVITVGGVRSLKTISDLLDGGKADYVAMSRPFIREPYLIERWLSGDTAKASCVSCNGVLRDRFGWCGNFMQSGAKTQREGRQGSAGVDLVTTRLPSRTAAYDRVSIFLSGKTREHIPAYPPCSLFPCFIKKCEPPECLLSNDTS